MKKKLFCTTLSEEGIYTIEAPFGVEVYVVLGEQKALVIDNGMGVGSLKKCLAELTQLPLCMITTHGHPDHAGGNGEFTEIFMHSADWEPFAKMCTVEYRTWDIQKMSGEIVEELVDFKGKFTALDSIASFDLGNRIIEILHTPGHTAGSVCLFDRQSRTLFAGDMLNEQTWLHLEHSLSVEVYRDSLKKILEKDWNITGIQTGHSRERIASSRLTQMLTCAEEILSNKTEDMQISTFAGDGLWHSCEGAGLLYCKERIWR